jgi:hypothetical protein
MKCSHALSPVLHLSLHRLQLCTRRGELSCEPEGQRSGDHMFTPPFVTNLACESCAQPPCQTTPHSELITPALGNRSLFFLSHHHQPCREVPEGGAGRGSTHAPAQSLMPASCYRTVDASQPQDLAPQLLHAYLLPPMLPKEEPPSNNLTACLLISRVRVKAPPHSLNNTPYQPCL